MKTRIALYRGRKSQNDHALIGDRLICWVTGNPWHTSPGDLLDWAVQQPGARVVPDDELRIAWSA